MIDMHYWLATSDHEKIGPLTLEQLCASPHFSPDALVWRAGLTSWVAASQLPEVACSLGIAAPVTAVSVTASVEQDDTMPERPRTYLGWAIAAVVLCCMIPAIVSVVYATLVSSRYVEGDYEGARHASSMAEMWLIVSIVFGIVELPFYIVLNLFS